MVVCFIKTPLLEMTMVPLCGTAISIHASGLGAFRLSLAAYPSYLLSHLLFQTPLLDCLQQIAHMVSDVT